MSFLCGERTKEDGMTNGSLWLYLVLGPIIGGIAFLVGRELLQYLRIGCSVRTQSPRRRSPNIRRSRRGTPWLARWFLALAKAEFMINRNFRARLGYPKRSTGLLNLFPSIHPFTTFEAIQYNTAVLDERKERIPMVNCTNIGRSFITPSLPPRKQVCTPDPRSGLPGRPYR